MISTGESHSVKELLQLAFEYVGLRWEDYVVADQSLVRPAEVGYLVGDVSKARERLGWTSGTDFKSLVRIMMEADLQQLSSVNLSR